MSSQDSIKMVLKCMLRGAADYLIKPMRKNELKNLWQHVWRRLTLRDDPTAHAQSLPASQHNLEDTDETSGDSRYHSDQGSGAQAISYNGHNKLMENAKSLDDRDEVKDSGRIDKKPESFDVTMDLIGGIDKRPECIFGDISRDACVGPELGLSLKRSCSISFENRDESKHQKLSLPDASAFLRFENSKEAEKAVVALEASSSGEPKTPTESHEKLRKVRSDQGSATTSSNQENIGSSSITGQCGQNELSFNHQVIPSAVTNQVQDSPVPVESNRLKASKEVEVGSQSTCCNTSEGIAGQSSSTEKKPKEEESAQQRWSRSQREAALMKFRLKRKDRCFDKKVRYQSRKKLAEQRPRVKGQFVRAVNSDSSTKA
ncbi:hypothetical protein CARUB_v10023453mg [Capsella rubella]|uniref:CCT domain-containing protein n=3 Tax=Capsella rubella TaxID=81985 RepID=R0FWJ1_9BRAS|nr:two-component response regulator-like APRR9 isoform X2 [Capsella rubella]EOA27337.1 hypothetical protein CARUB_v10023453mg [Capsella rubella]